MKNRSIKIVILVFVIVSFILIGRIIFIGQDKEKKGVIPPGGFSQKFREKRENLQENRLLSNPLPNSPLQESSSPQADTSNHNSKAQESLADNALTDEISRPVDSQKNVNQNQNDLSPAISLPEKVFNKAPFISQAPFANWDHLHEEACEEAAMITAHFYRLGQEKISKEEAEREILKLVDYQKINWGGHHDLKAEDIQKLAKVVYGDEYQLIRDFSLEELKAYLADEYLIIVPAAGRVLENPYFKQPGPLYHALVIIGYDEKKEQFITNDPGTKRGASFAYSYQNLIASIHDFPGKKENILQGEKVVLLVKK